MPKQQEKTPENKADKQSAVFSIVGQYAKDISFECPIPAFAKEAENLNVQMDVKLVSRKLMDDLYETVLNLKFEAQNEDKNTCFLLELAYTGVFNVKGVEADQIEPILQVDGASIIYPFARQMVMSLIADAGFRAPQLAPINFHALYVKNKEAQKGNSPENKKKEQAS